MSDSNQNQGEGNVEAARRYDQSQQQFVESGKVEQAARDAAPESDQKAHELERAEQKGRERAKGEDPAVSNPEAGSSSEKR